MRRADGSSKATLAVESPHQSRVSWIDSPIPPIQIGLAVVWLIGFFLWFQSFELPNNHIDRWMLWEGLPYRLLDLVDPPSTPKAPWSWLFVLQRTPFFLIAIATWMGSGAIGSLILRSLSIDAKGPERLYFSAGVGLSAFSLIMLFLGLNGWMSRWPLMIVLAGSVIVEIACRNRELRRPTASLSSRASSTIDARSKTLGWVLFAVLALFVFGQQLGAMTPQVDFDVLEYHLGGPKEWFQLGRIQRLPHNVYTSFPFLTEMLILSSMVLYGDWDWGALAGQSVIAGFIPLTAIGVYSAGRRWFSKGAGWLAALVYLTSPWTYRISIIAYAEGGLSYYLFAALFAALRYGFPATEPAPNDRRAGLNWIFLSGLLAGSAMACKYTGLVFVVIPVGLILVSLAALRSKESRLRRIALVGLIYGIGVACAIGPWLLKNAVETGNPVFPLAAKIFGGADRDGVLNTKWSHGHGSPYPNWTAAIMDFRIKLQDVVSKNDWHTPLLFGLAPLSLLYCRRRRESAAADSASDSNRMIIRLAWLYAGWQFANWWLLTHHIDRFYIPMFSGVSLLAGIGAYWWQAPNQTDQNRPRFWNGILGFVVIAGVLYNLDIMQLLGGFNAGRTDLTIARDTAIAHTVPRQKWINDAYASGAFPADFKVLCTGEADLFHAHYPYVYNTAFDHSLFEKICADPNFSDHRLRPAAEILAELRRQGITHIDVSWGEILRYRAPGSYGYTDFVHPDRFLELQQIGVLGPAIHLPADVSLAPLNDERREQLEKWAPRLMTTVAGEPAYITAQMFPVLDPNR